MPKNKGYIGILALIILSLAALKYFFDWSILEFLETQAGQGTVEYIKQVLLTAWSYLKNPVLWIWTEVVSPIVQAIWQQILDILTPKSLEAKP